MLEQIFYKIVIFAPYILFIASVISLILGFRNKQKHIPSKKYFISAVVMVILAIVIFLIPLAIVLITYLKAV